MRPLDTAYHGAATSPHPSGQRIAKCAGTMLRQYVNEIIGMPRIGGHLSGVASTEWHAKGHRW